MDVVRMYLLSPQLLDQVFRNYSSPKITGRKNLKTVTVKPQFLISWANERLVMLITTTTYRRLGLISAPL